MKTKIILLLLFVLAVLQGLAQNGGFNFRFVDEQTGIAVVPGYISIYQMEDAKVRYFFKKDSLPDNGTLSMLLPNGTYDITVNAKGYESMTANITIFNQNQIGGLGTWRLKPLTPVRELSVDYMRSVSKPDSMAFLGFVVDDSTGKPMQDVSVYTGDNVVITHTNEQGFYQLIFPLPAHQNDVENRGTILFAKDNYITEVYKDFNMWSKGNGGYNPRMKTGSGFDTIHEYKQEERMKPLRYTLDMLHNR